MTGGRATLKARGVTQCSVRSGGAGLALVIEWCKRRHAFPLRDSDQKQMRSIADDLLRQARSDLTTLLAPPPLPGSPQQPVLARREADAPRIGATVNDAGNKLPRPRHPRHRWPPSTALQSSLQARQRAAS